MYFHAFSAHAHGKDIAIFASYSAQIMCINQVPPYPYLLCFIKVVLANHVAVQREGIVECLSCKMHYIAAVELLAQIFTMCYVHMPAQLEVTACFRFLSSRWW